MSDVCSHWIVLEYWTSKHQAQTSCMSRGQLFTTLHYTALYKYNKSTIMASNGRRELKGNFYFFPLIISYKCIYLQDFE